MEGKSFIESDIYTENIGRKSTNNSGSSEKEKLLNHLTLEDTLNMLGLDDILSKLDNDLQAVVAQQESMEKHKEYFRTHIDKKIKKLSKDFHPDRIRQNGGSETDVLQALEVQKKINSVRLILQYFNNEFSKYYNFKYSFFAKIEFNTLNNKQQLEQISYGILTKLGDLASIKHEKLIPNFNKFLRSSQASVQHFCNNKLDYFLEERSNAMKYLNKYVNKYTQLINELHQLKKAFVNDRESCPTLFMVNEMLQESRRQYKILSNVHPYFELTSQIHVLVQQKLCQGFDLPYYIDCKQDYEHADRYFTLPIIEYVNILSMCSEIYLNQHANKSKWNALIYHVTHFVLTLPTGGLINKLIPSNQVFNGIANEEINDVLGKEDDVVTDNLVLLRKILVNLVAYYCYDYTICGEFVAKSLCLDNINKEIGGSLLIKIASIYADYLAKKFEPLKDFDEQIAAVQRQYQETMRKLCNDFLEDMKRDNNEVYKIAQENLEERKEYTNILRKNVEEMNEERKKMQEIYESTKMRKLMSDINNILMSASQPEGSENIYKPTSNNAGHQVHLIEQ